MNKNHALMKIQTHDTWDVGRVVVIFNETKNKHFAFSPLDHPFFHGKYDVDNYKVFLVS